MFAHALTYPSLRNRPARPTPKRRARAVRRPPPLFLRSNTQHLRVVPRARAARAAWLREIARLTLALASVAAISAALYLAF